MGDLPGSASSVLRFRHAAEDFLHAYTSAVDDQDLATVCALLSGTKVTFDRAGAVSGPALDEHYRTAFAAGGDPTRHLVCVGRVELTDDPARAVAHYPYQRWAIKTSGPEIDALGSYRLELSWRDRLRVSAIHVRRIASG